MLLQKSLPLIEKKGMKRVEVAAVKDKHQTTAMFACTLDGKFLPIQIIYQGTTSKCHLKDVQFPAGWLMSHIENQTNETTTIDYIRNIIVSYVNKERKLLHGPQQCMITMHWYSLMCSKDSVATVQVLDDNHILCQTTV